MAISVADGDCDNDEVTNDADNCPAVANPDQTNSDSYATGDVTGGGTVANIADVAMKMLTELIAPTNSAPDIYALWQSNSWNFGTNAQFPALRSFEDNNDDGDNADIGEKGIVLCGQPGQRDTTPARVSRAACENTLVPLP